MKAEDVRLSIAEWSILGIIAENQTHGFAIAREFAADGAIGKIWTLPRPLVYRAVTVLTEQKLIARAGSAPGDGGPQRTLLKITPTGKAAIDYWVQQPVDHVRDARSNLIVKMLLLHRAGKSSAQLIERQRKLLVAIIENHEERVANATSFDEVIAQWRLINARALETFLETIEKSPFAFTEPATH